MSTYLIVKTLHILSSVVLVGTGFGSAFYLFWVNRTHSLEAKAVVARWVIKADWWLTTPAGIFQPLSGLWMLHYMKMPLSWDGAWLWVKWTLALYVFAGLCWLPVLRLQIRMAELAESALKQGASDVSPEYRRCQKYWEFLGYPAFCAMLIIYFLMVLKPM